MSRRRAFSLLLVATVVMLRAPLAELLRLGFQDERYAYILFVPAISVYLIWLRKEKIFTGSPLNAMVCRFLLLAAAALLITIAKFGVSGGPTLGFSLTIFGVLLIFLAEFGACFGPTAVLNAIFPISLLLLAIPIPAHGMEQAVAVLQKASAEVSYALFKLAHVPVTRDGFVFSLPGVDIEVARECSGIRSSLSLLICSILAAHLLLRSGVSQVLFTLLTVPVVIFKNAVRIVTISWLGVYVDRGFFSGNLHHYGGLPFSLFAIGILLLLLRFLRKLEAGPEKRSARLKASV